MAHTLDEMQRRLAADHGWSLPVVPGTFAAQKSWRRTPRLTVMVRGRIVPPGAHGEPASVDAVASVMLLPRAADMTH